MSKYTLYSTICTVYAEVLSIYTSQNVGFGVGFGLSCDPISAETDMSVVTYFDRSLVKAYAALLCPRHILQ